MGQPVLQSAEVVAVRGDQVLGIGLARDPQRDVHVLLVQPPLEGDEVLVHRPAIQQRLGTGRRQRVVVGEV